MLNLCDYEVETYTTNNDCASIDQSADLELDCKSRNQSHKSEDNNTQSTNEIMLHHSEIKNVEDCKNLFPYPFVDQRCTAYKRKGEKYFPHFKSKVVAYALEHSIKKASADFKVDKGTISGWIHESQHQQTVRKSLNTNICYNYPGPDEQFIAWLKTFKGSGIISRQDVIDKVRDIVGSFQKEEPNKASLWFFLYAKRLTDESCLDKMKIKYPVAFKKEVASCTKYMSKKMTSKVFNIDRKRICEWVSDFSSGSQKARDVSKYVTDPKVDKMIWDWYCLQQSKPSSKEIRLKAAIMYQDAGFPGMRCSPGWYYRWRMRYQLPTARGSLASRDSKLLTWALIQMDENKSIFHSDLLKQASFLKEATFKASSSWVFRFVKRYMSQFKPGIVNIPLPESLNDQVNNFKELVFTTIAENKLQLENIVAFDEVPLSFTLLDSGKQGSFVGKNGWENCHASIIVSCLASGTLLPTALILKDPIESYAHSPDIEPVLVQADGINDNSTMENWLKVLLRDLTMPAMIISDIYNPHIHVKNMYTNEFDKRNINFMIIPGGCTLNLQPLYFGIVQKFKAEIENHWVRWCRQVSQPGDFKLRHPGNEDIFCWVKNAHLEIAKSCQDLIKESFTKAGIINRTSY